MGCECFGDRGIITRLRSRLEVRFTRLQSLRVGRVGLNLHLDLAHQFENDTEDSFSCLVCECLPPDLTPASCA